MNTNNFKVSFETPTPEEYSCLRKTAGMSEKSIESARIGLPNSLFSVIIRSNNGELLGMGRIVGDGGCQCQVVDIAVFPK